MKKLLEVKNLKTCFFQDGIEVPVVDDVSFFIKQNSVLGFVGESGCGKTMTALSLTNLLTRCLPMNPVAPVINNFLFFMFYHQTTPFYRFRQVFCQ